MREVQRIEGEIEGPRGKLAGNEDGNQEATHESGLDPDEASSFISP